MTITWRRLFIPLSVVPFLFLLAYGFKTDPRAVPSPLVAKEAPPFSLRLFDGGRLTLQELRGKVVVVNFWASWCYPACYEEAPLLEGAWRAYKNKGVMIVGVNIQDTEKGAREFMGRFNFTFPNGSDPKGKISIEYGVYGVPETFLIDQEGRIAYKHVGALTAETLSRQLQKLLGLQVPRVGRGDEHGA